MSISLKDCVPNRRRGLARKAQSAEIELTFVNAMQHFDAKKPITFVVPFVAGGTTDILARLVGQAMSEDLGQPVVIDNRAGAGGNIAGQFASRVAAGGDTLFMGTVGTNAINEWLYAKLPFKPNQDLARLTRVANVPNLLVANPQQPFKTVKELIVYAKANPAR